MSHVKPIHPSDDRIEMYAMGMLAGLSLRAFEKHLFICRECRTRVEDTDLFLAMLRQAFDSLEDHSGTATRSELASVGAEKRKKIRNACQRIVALRLIGDSPPFKSVVGLLVDESESGMGIYANASLPIGHRVLVWTPAARHCGVISYCVKEKNLFRLGVTYQDDPGNKP